MTELPLIIVRDLVRYDPDKGCFYYLPNKLATSTWNKRAKNNEKVHETVFKSSYLMIGIRLNGNQHLISSHRLAFALFHGKWPEKTVDHKDGNGFNNKISNLREATSQQQSANRRSSKGSTSKFKGVSWNTALGKWTAAIKVNGIHIFLGVHEDELNAAKAYDNASIKHFGSYSRTNFQ